MNYKETLFFVGKCLTINHEKHNYDDIENQLKNNTIDWESVVKLSTAHYVFPALYCNLKKANFLSYLPSDLVDYMKHITDLNRERNQQIIEQAKEINELLLSNNITPIFLKGTGNLLEGLYDDIAERMVGDIDFIVSKQHYELAFNTLLKFGYETILKNDNHFPQFKHKPSIVKKGSIAAIEVHRNLIESKFIEEFNYDVISKTILKIDKFNYLSYSNQLALSIFAKQLNDNGFDFKNIALRNSYDVLLLSKKVNTKEVAHQFKNLFNALNSYLAITSEVLSKPKSISFIQNEGSKRYISDFYRLLNNAIKRKRVYKITSNKLLIKKRLSILKKSITNKEYRNWLFKRIKERDWQQRKLIQLGLKKAKPKS